ncbi:MAG: hypothetical protein IKN52_01175, partial [Victivallales bacterium]|nr:hypothetical protein [Victivallales bacterium]
CLLVWRLDEACGRLRMSMMAEIKEAEEDGDEFMSETDVEETADDHHADDGRRQIARLKLAIRKNRTREREMKSALQEEAFLDAWHEQGLGYRCQRYILSGEKIDVQGLMELIGASREDCEEALEVFQKRTLKSLIELRQQELDQTFEKLVTFLHRMDLSRLSLEEQDQLRKYKESWKAWTSEAYSNKNSLEEKMELFQSLKQQDEVIQTMLIRNLDHVHHYPVADYAEKVEKARDAFRPLVVKRGNTITEVVEDPGHPGRFLRLNITF